MNLLTTMKQALEALELAKTSGTLEWKSAPIDNCIDNLRAAIEQVEKAEPATFVDSTHTMFSKDVCGVCYIPLFTFPPDAQAEIEALREMLAAAPKPGEKE